GGGSIRHLSLAVAGWMRYASGRDERGGTIEVSDPLAARFAAIASRAGGDAGRLASGLLGLDAIFGADLPRIPAFTVEVTRHLDALLRRGVAATVAEHLAH
ncbi:MAG TPA: mannitol dehydrogenase family protein, partial [Casimicrobiaceae bacterium]|nr:mannitol dehydrogenase family protein [Casimicrobiaceae bacterium]